MKSVIDSNVFNNPLDGGDPRNPRIQAIADAIVRRALADGSTRISRQVVKDCLNAALHMAAVRLQPAEARPWLDVVLLPLMKLVPTPVLYQHTHGMQERRGFGIGE